MIVLGLTGSIGMGKSTTARMFADLGIPVHDSDAAVHALYSGRAVPLVEAAFPGSTRDGAVDRAELWKHVFQNPQAMARLEAIVHPLVREDREHFLLASRGAGADIVVLDVPLLFESRAEDSVDAIVVVTAAPEEQRRRVLARPGMTPEKLDTILARQVPDAVKRSKADFLVVTDSGLDNARRQVADIVAALRSGSWTPKKSTAVSGEGVAR